MVVIGIQQAIKSEGLRRCGRCCVSVVLMFVLSLSLLCLSPPLHTFRSKPVRPCSTSAQICPIPSNRHCALEHNVTPSMDMKGSTASDREIEGGQFISPRVLALVLRPLLQGQQPRSCHWSVQSQLP